MFFPNENIFYSNTIDIIYDDESPGWNLSSAKIEKLKQHKLFVLDLSSEHWGAGVIQTAYDALYSKGINFIILSYDYHDHCRLPNLFYFPYWYHSSIKLLKSYNGCANKILFKKYKWSCYNTKPRIHRIYNYIYSTKKSYFFEGNFVMNIQDGSIIGSPGYDDVVLDDDIVEQWKKLQKPTITPLFAPWAPKDIDVNSYIHLVTETTVIPKVFITEKTWTPIACGKIFLIYGNPGTIKFLRSQGVDVFDDLIDHSYDDEPDWKIRCHMIHEQLEKLIKMDLVDLYASTRSRRDDNTKKFYSGDFDQQYFKEIQDSIDKKLS